MRLVHSSSAPLVLYSGLRHSSTGGEELKSTPQHVEDSTSDELLAFRHKRRASLPSLVFSATLQRCTRPFDDIRKQVFADSRLAPQSWGRIDSCLLRRFVLPNEKIVFTSWLPRGLYLLRSEMYVVIAFCVVILFRVALIGSI